MADNQTKPSNTSLKRKAEDEESCKPAKKMFFGLPAKDTKWKWKGTLLYYRNEDVKGSEKIAGFDFDQTLVKTSFANHGPDAWTILYPQCIQRLQEFHNKGFKLVIFTNQGGIGRAKTSRDKVIAEKKGRILGFIRMVGLPFQVFVATSKDHYRKPHPGMWKFMKEYCNDGVAPDLTQCFYVGDAAGRRKDHSADDKNFAKNCGLIFHTEDEFFRPVIQKNVITVQSTQSISNEHQTEKNIQESSQVITNNFIKSSREMGDIIACASTENNADFAQAIVEGTDGKTEKKEEDQDEIALTKNEKPSQPS